MTINYSKKSKISFLLSTILLGAVSLSASPINIEIKKANTAGIPLGSEIINETYQNSTNISSNINLDLGQWIDGISGPSAITIVDNSILENKATINLKATSNQVANNYDDEDDIDVAARGISLWNVKNKSIILNSGTISTDVTAKSLATSVGIEVVSANLDNSIVSNSEIKNTGTIKTVSKSDDIAVSAGIVLEEQIVKSKIINDGTVEVIASGKNSSAAWGMALEAYINELEIKNNGKLSIKADGQNAHAEAIVIENISNSEIINNGTIEANTIGTSSSGAHGIWIDDAVATQIENRGNILVNANGNGSGYFIAEAIGIGSLEDSNIINSGTIKATRNNKLDKQGLAITLADVLDLNSTVTNTSSGKIYGNILMDVHKNSSFIPTFKNEGFISLPYNATKKETFTFDDDGIPTTISLQPNLGNFVNSGTIEIGAFKHSNNTIENTQILTKTATFEKGSKMQVDVVAGSKAFVKGDTLSEVVTATDKLTINDLTLNQTKLADNSATLDFKYEVKDGKRIDLVVSKVNAFEEAGNTQGNAKNVSQVLDKLRTDPNLGSLVAKLDTLNPADLNRALDTLTPTIAAAISNTSSQISSSVSNVISSRLGSGANSGDEMVLGNSTLWTKLYGSLGEQKEKDGINGFDLKTYGLGLGYENEYKDGQLLGTGLFYTNANVDINGVSQKTDVDAYSIALYGNNLLKDNKTTIYYQGAYTWQKNDSKRDLFDGTQANAKFTTKILSLDLGVGHKININESLHMEPKLGVTYKHYSNPNYSETGSSANITTNKFTSSELLGNAELNMGYKINDFSKITATAGVGYDFKNDNNIVTSSFSAAPSNSFDTKGIDNGRWNYLAGLGYDVDVNNQNNINVSYNFQGEGSKYTNHGLALNYRYKF